MKYIFNKFSVLLFVINSLFLPAEIPALIIEIDQIEEILKEVDQEAWVLFDIDQTLIDSSSTFGSGPWNSYLKATIDKLGKDNPLIKADLFDYITLLAARKVPVKPVEPIIPLLIDQLQSQQVVVMGLTARGKREWYTSYIEDGDKLARDQLRSVGIFLDRTILPHPLSHVEDSLDLSPYCGIFLAGNFDLKGVFLKTLLEKIEHVPSKIIFVDDAVRHINSVENELDGIVPVVAYHYNRVIRDNHSFDPQIGNIQLHAFLFEGRILTDEDAAQIKKEMCDIDPEQYLKKILEVILEGN